MSSTDRRSTRQSLGGNLLLKHLGESAQSGMRAGIAVSVPFLLRDAMLRLGLGASRIYQRHLVGRLKASSPTHGAYAASAVGKPTATMAGTAS